MAQRDNETSIGREFQVLTRQTCYKGFFRLERLGLIHSLHGGGMSAVLSREIVERALQHVQPAAKRRGVE